MAMNIFKPIFPCKLVTNLLRERPLKFITESPTLHELKTRTKVSTAKKIIYRSKDFMKLKQMDKKFKLVQPGHKVLDIGAAPGSWSQYLAAKTNANGKDKEEPVGLVVAIDLQSFDAIEGVHCLPKMDFLKKTSQSKIAEILGRGEKFDFIFSDISPCVSGVQYSDQNRMSKLVFCVYLFAMQHLKQGGGCLIRLQGTEESPSIKKEAQKKFKTVSFHVPVVASTFLPDMYLLGTNFVGVKI